MKFICKICGYVYDEEREGVPFASLPDTWRCPLCRAAKSDFAPEIVKTELETKKTEKNIDPVSVSEDLKHLSISQMAAVCTNLARGCEKQYRFAEADKFKALATYFDSITSTAKESEVSDILSLLNYDLDKNYPSLTNIASEKGDRGTLRVKNWGEKVTLILKSLLERYESNGNDFLQNTDIWICTVCGFVFVGSNPPELCPVCKVPAWKFEKIERNTAL